MSKAGLSLALRADGWKVYCVSTAPYPATTTLPGKIEQNLLMDSISVLFPTGRWAWRELPVHLGPALGLANCPRDSRFVAHTTAIVHTLTGRFAGSPDAQLEVLDRIDELRNWATRTHNPWLTAWTRWSGASGGHGASSESSERQPRCCCHRGQTEVCARCLLGHVVLMMLSPRMATLRTGPERGDGRLPMGASGCCSEDQGMGDSVVDHTATVKRFTRHAQAKDAFPT